MSGEKKEETRGGAPYTHITLQELCHVISLHRHNIQDFLGGGGGSAAHDIILLTVSSLERRILCPFSVRAAVSSVLSAPLATDAPAPVCGSLKDVRASISSIPPPF